MSLSDIAGWIRSETGIDSATVGGNHFARVVDQRMAACGIASHEEYRARLLIDRPEMKSLIEAVVVPETWFFRDPEAYAFLVEISRLWPREGFQARLLSAPCSTGEEPYSMAMTLLDAGWSPVRFRIDAIDISGASLARAEAGRYGSNAFRGEGHEWTERFGKMVDERKFELEPRVRRTVSFKRANLMKAEAWGIPGLYDIIFCRHALIYFDAANQARVLDAFRRMLAPKGVLFVGASEAYLTRSHGFAPTAYPSAFRVEEAPAPARPKLMASLPAAAMPAPAARPVTKASAPRPAPAKALPMRAVPDLSEAVRLADSGRLREARDLCRACLSADPTAAEAHYLLGLLHDAAGEKAAACKSYRRVLYLQPQHAEALRQLALHAEKDGDRPGAQRLLRRAVRSEGASAR